MFGYVLPREDKLSEQEKARYRAAYCGLCRSLKLRYGFAARFLVNYDMTFLYFLLQDTENRQPERCFCPARVVCKKDCLPSDPVMEFCADMSVLLSYWKLRDAQRDGNVLHRAFAGTAIGIYKKSWQGAARKFPDANRIFAEQLERLNRLEDECCPSIDRTADAFASLLRVCADFCEEEAKRRALQVLLYHVGRYLYLADALEDLPKDNRRGSYNPLRYRYQLHDGKLSDTDKKQLLETVDASINLAASALELLPRTEDYGILKNIIYYGLPTVLSCVAEGTFRKKGNKHERSL